MRTRFGSGSSNCCCDENCLLNEDDFNRPDTHPIPATSDFLGPLWLDQAYYGIRSQLVTNLQPINSEAGDPADIFSYDEDGYNFLDNATDAGFPPNEVVQVRTRIRTEDDRSEVLLCRADSGTWLGVELRANSADTLTCGSIRCFEVVAGVKNYLGEDAPVSTAFLGDWHTLKACFRSTSGYGYDYQGGIAGELSARVTTASGEVVAICVEATPGGERLALRGGFGSDYAHGGDAIRGFDPDATVQWDDFKTYRISYDDDRCPDCKAPCELFSDDYERTLLGCKYIIFSGTHTIVSGKLESNGLVVVDVQHSSCDEYGMRASARMLATATGTIARLIVGLVDANNYHFLQLQFGSPARLSLYSREGGVDTLLAGPTNVSGLTLGTEVILTICWTEGVLFGSISSNVTPISLMSEAAWLGGYRAAYQSNAAVKWDDLSIEQTTGVDDDNVTPCATCGPLGICVDKCLDDEAPQIIVLRISQLLWSLRSVQGDGDSTIPSDCGPCRENVGADVCPSTLEVADLNGTFILEGAGAAEVQATYYLDGQRWTGLGCLWNKTIYSAAPITAWKFFIFEHFDGRYVIQARLQHGGEFIAFQKIIGPGDPEFDDATGKLKCLFFSDEYLHWAGLDAGATSVQGHIGGNVIDGSNAWYGICAVVEASGI